MEQDEYSGNITIYFDDGSSNIGKKDGVYLDIKNNIIFFRDNKGLIEGIPICRVFRFVFPAGDVQ